MALTGFEALKEQEEAPQTPKLAGFEELKKEPDPRLQQAAQARGVAGPEAEQQQGLLEGAIADPTQIQQMRAGAEQAIQEGGVEKTVWPAIRDDLIGVAERSLERIGRDFDPTPSLKRPFLQLVEGYNRGAAGFWESLDGIAGLVAEITGTDKLELFEQLKQNVPVGRIEADSLIDKINQGLGSAPGGIVEFMVGRGMGRLATVGSKSETVKTIGEVLGVVAYGGASRFNDGPTAMAHGAMEFALMDTFLRGVAPMPRLERIGLAAPTFAGLALSQGQSVEDAVAAGAVMGILTATGAPGNRNMSLAGRINDAVRKSDAFQKAVTKRADMLKQDAKALEDVTRQVTLDYIKKHYPDVAERIEAEGFGKVRVKGASKQNVVEQVDAELGRRLGMNAEQSRDVDIRSKMELIIDRVDPGRKLSEGDRRRYIDGYMEQLWKWQKLAAEPTPARDVPVEGQAQPAIKGQRKPVPETPEQNLAMVRDVHRKAEEARLDAEKKFARSFRSRLRVGLIDASADVKQALLRDAGEAGRLAVQNLELRQGAVVRAQYFIDLAEADAFSGLNRADRTALNDIIEGRRVIEIDRSKVKPVKHPGNLGGEHYKRALQALEKEVGTEKFNQLQERADAYFGHMRQAVRRLRDEGIISGEQAQKLMRFDYSKRIELINEIDKVTQFDMGGGRKISVTDSGIRQLDQGTFRFLETDARELMAQVIARTEGRIMSNRANQGLRKSAVENPGPPSKGKFMGPEFLKVLKDESVLKHDKFGKLVKEPDPPSGFITLKTFENGKQFPVYLESNLAQQWATTPQAMKRWMANSLRIGSGTALVKPLATGYNPGFVITNLPRDALHIWLSTGEYSSFLPGYGLQFGRDMLSVFPDALFKTKAADFKRKLGVKNPTNRYLDFIQEGGGMNFLAHQGREALRLTPDNRMTTRLSPALKRTQQVAGFLNEFSEVWTRLALRERAMRNGRAGPEATWIARNYMDFAQGGVLIKGADNFIPYINASTQAWRGVFRQAKKQPGRFALQASQLMGTAAGFYIANMQTNPEAWAQIPDEIRNQYWVITTPMFTMDQQGNKRFLYFPIKKDETIVPVTSWIESVLARQYEGRIPDQTAIAKMAELQPFMPTRGTGIPMVDAYVAYAGNKDLYFDRDIWRGPRVFPEQEIQEAPSRPTSPFAIAAAQGISSVIPGMDQPGKGVSPIRLEGAFNKMVPNNTFTGLVGQGWKYMVEGMTPFDQAKTTEMLLAETPLVRRVMKLTHPAAEELRVLEKEGLRSNTRREVMTRTLDRLIFENEQGALEGGEQTLQTFIADPNKSGPERELLLDRLHRQRVLERVFSRRDLKPGVPSRITWINASSLPAEARANWFYERWIYSDGETRRQLESIANGISSKGGIGFTSPDFMRKFKWLRKHHGEERP